MTTAQIPRGPWYNPDIPDGDHHATIQKLKKGTYGPNLDSYLQIVLWLPGVEEHFVTNLYFPDGQSHAKTVQRLSRLCQIVGLLPQDALDSPEQFVGAELTVRVKRFMNRDHEYCDVELFLTPEA